MSRRVYSYIRQHHLGLVAIFIALSGTAYAASFAPRNSVRTKSIRNGAITGAKLAHNSVTGADVVDKSLTGADIASSSLGLVPHAANADQLGGSGPAAFQSRINGTCPAGQAAQSVGTDGSLGCGATVPADGSVGTAKFATLPAAAIGVSGNPGTFDFGTNTCSTAAVASSTLTDIEPCRTAIDFDDAGMTSDQDPGAGTAFSKLTAPVAGTYVVSGFFQWSANASGFRRLILQRVSHFVGTTIAITEIPGTASDTAAEGVSGVTRLAAGDSVRLRARQDSGASLTVQNMGLNAAWIGP